MTPSISFTSLAFASSLSLYPSPFLSSSSTFSTSFNTPITFTRPTPPQCRRPCIYATQTTPAVSTSSTPPAPDNNTNKNKKKKSTNTSSQLGKLLVIGLSHHTATVDVREKLAVPEHEWQQAAAQLCQLESISEAAVLSTCNRFELYLVVTQPFAAIQQTIAHLSTQSSLSVQQLRKHLFMLTEDEACWHLLRVSSGLDSLVIGEGQILAQVKRCYELASENKKGHAGKILTRLLNSAVSAGKRVRSETGIAQGAVSISSAAVELAEHKVVPDIGLPIEDCHVCIVGAGKMSRLLVQHLISKDVSHITIVNRSMTRAEELAKMFPETQINIELMPNLMQCIHQSDVVFTSTAADHCILTKDNMSTTTTNNTKTYDMRQQIVIDISVPRNVSVDVNDLDHVHSYNVDDLKAVVAKNQARRRRLILEAEKVLHEEQTTFNNWHNSLGCIPAISKLQQRAESIRQDEMDRVKGKLAGLSQSELKAVEQLSRGIINKMLHSPMVHLRELDDMEERTMTLKHIEALFKL